MIYWGAIGNDPKCIHPDCVGKEQKFTYAGIYNHVIDEHSPDPDDTVSIFFNFKDGDRTIFSHKKH